jgi:hypothetical protein
MEPVSAVYNHEYNGLHLRCDPSTFERVYALIRAELTVDTQVPPSGQLSNVSA